MRRSKPISVLIVDDSALVRSILTSVLSEPSDIEVVGGAKDPFEARELIIEFRPDVIVLDIEMPRMDGITFLRKLRTHYPVPVIMCSGVAPANSQAALAAIEAGAVDIVAKPSTGGSRAMARLGEDLAEKIRAAAVAISSKPHIPVSAVKPISFQASGFDPRSVVVGLGASTGGTEAIKTFLSHVPPDFPPIVMVQHMPEGFTKSFAERLDEECALRVSEAVDGDKLEPGRALLARGNIQMRVAASGGVWRIAYGNDEPVNRHCPSVDVLFDSLAEQMGKQLVGVILTGMGSDGAKGLLGLRNAGAVTFGQNQESSVVYGMPKVAAELGAVQHTGAPQQIPRAIIQALKALKSTRHQFTASARP